MAQYIITYRCQAKNKHNNRIHSDRKKRRSCLALLLASGDAGVSKFRSC
jgi:hypothetical protein